MSQALFFLIKTVTQLYLLMFLIRFLLQWVRADFYNPLSQFVVKVTNPLVVPARRVIPSASGIDVATLVVLVALETVITLLLITFVGGSVALVQLVVFVLLRLVTATITLYTFMILIAVILSWVAPAQANPLTLLLAQLTEPVLRPARRVLPPIGGLDLSPLLVLILLQAVLIAIPLPGYLR